MNAQLPREPRRQVALPDSPPLTPPQFKGKLGAQNSSFSALRDNAPLSVDIGAEHETRTFDRQDRGPLSPEDLPRQTGNVGLGFAFNLNQADSNNDKFSSAYEDHPMSLSIPGKALRSHGFARSKLSSGRAMLPRIPRRVRPALILATSLLAIVFIVVSRSVGAPTVSAPPYGASFGRRTPGAQALYDINDEQAQEAESDSYTREMVFDSRPPPPAPSPNAIHFTSKRDELLTLIGFITAATGNSLPSHIDPSETIDMSVLVGFDPAGEGAAEDLDLLKDEVNAQYPLVLFGRMRDPWHQEVVRTLEQWKIVPEPLIVDVDQRRDAATFEPVLERLLGTGALPQLVLEGESLGGAQDVLGMEPDHFKSKLEKSGLMTVSDAKKKKKGALQAERDRMHRLLRPEPIAEY